MLAYQVYIHVRKKNSKFKNDLGLLEEVLKQVKPK